MKRRPAGGFRQSVRAVMDHNDWLAYAMVCHAGQDLMELPLAGGIPGRAQSGGKPAHRDQVFGIRQCRGPEARWPGHRHCCRRHAVSAEGVDARDWSGEVAFDPRGRLNGAEPET